jgi:hypothetical protein
MAISWPARACVAPPNAGDSEAIITRNGKPTLAQLRAEMKALPASGRGPW